LDRFSRFFIDPLFDKNCTESELNAVDSEYKGYQQRDGRRISQVETLVENPGYMWYSFSVGNVDTLKKIPESTGLNVREALLKFYSDNYSANVMTLAVLGRGNYIV
jgi:insulysin